METYSVELPNPEDNKEVWDQFQALMDNIQDDWDISARELSFRLNISTECASDILYLRTRSRWSQENEDYLIWLGQNNKPLPNINDDFDVPENYNKSDLLL
jgi:hypothetical protein